MRPNRLIEGLRKLPDGEARLDWLEQEGLGCVLVKMSGSVCNDKVHYPLYLMYAFRDEEEAESYLHTLQGHGDRYRENIIGKTQIHRCYSRYPIREDGSLTLSECFVLFRPAAYPNVISDLLSEGVMTTIRPEALGLTFEDMFMRLQTT